MSIRNGPRTAHGRGQPPVPEVPWAWMSATAAGAWSARIPNSTGAGGSAIDAYSDFAITPNLDVLIGATGGHGNSSDNRVVKMALGSDSPSGWETLLAQSASVQVDVPYYADGRPSSRHTYDKTVHDPDTGRLLLIGAYGVYGQADAFNTIDGFDLATNQWDVAGTWPYTYGTSLSGVGAYNWGVVRDKSTGNIFWSATGGVISMWKPGQATVTIKSGTGYLANYPNCWDSSRNAIFSLMWGDGSDAQPELGLFCRHWVNPSTTSASTQQVLTMSGSGWTQFQTDQPAYGGMDYDVLRDKFVFGYGSTDGLQGPLRLIEVTPNGTSTWGMEIVTPTGSAPANVNANGLNGRLKYVQRGGIGGFIVMTTASDGFFFFRTT